jgi:hypothetical protein
MNQQQSIEINRHLRTFLSLSKLQPFNIICVKSALYLIQNLPASRHSVFEYLNTLFNVATHLNRKPNNQEGYLN